MGEEEVLAGGNVTTVVRVGDTVRRPLGPWSTNVHALLNHLRAKAVDIAPRVYGIDERGREILSFVPGGTGTYPDGWPFSDDDYLVEVGACLRRLHDASADFVAPDGYWRFQVGAPRSGEVICHNDFAPYNCVFQGDRIAAVIDWDFAAPAPRDWDLVHALWRFTPLYPPADWWLGSQPPFSTARLVHRMRRLCHGYGTELVSAHLDLLERRQVVVFDTVKTFSAQHVPGFESMFADAETEADFAELAHLRQIKAGLAAEIVATS